MQQFTPHPLSRQLFLVLGHGLAGIGAAVGAFLARVHLRLPFTEALLPADKLQLVSLEWLVVLVTQPLLLYLFGLYDTPLAGERAERARRLMIVAGLQGLGLAGFYFLADRTFPRSVVVLFVVLNCLLLLGVQFILERVKDPRERRLAIVGAGTEARELAEAIREHESMQLKVVGFVPEPGAEAVVEDPSLGPCLGTIDDLPGLLSSGAVDDVVLAQSGYSWQTHLIDQLAGQRPKHCNVLMLPGPFESLISRTRYRWVRDLPLVEVVRQSEWRVNQPLKRALDLVAGSGLLLLALPVMAACAVLVRVTSPGPVIYRQQRVGLGREVFEVWKFRTMQQDAERETGVVLAQRDDPRLTSIGGTLRRLRLDELPQLFQVLGGTMSLVGPRPERPTFVDRYLEETPGYAERFSLRPGLTGLAQVNGDYHSSARNKLRYDLAYLANWNLWLDLAILFRTIKIVLTSRGT
jgi:exopolysaccharide biosynthesis polyprenyl glycosylphosphotransferase